MKNPKVRQIVLPLITAMIWGSSFVTQSLSAGHLGCFSFNALRSIPAALALLLLLLVVPNGGIPCRSTIFFCFA